MTWDPANGMTEAPGVQAESAAQPASSSSLPGAGPAPTAPGGAPPVASLPALAPLVTRDVDPGAGPVDAPVQREEAAPTGGDGAAVAGGSMPEAQLDDLARRLHERISARISRDLLIERERVGSLVDRTW
jgi:hypothetical protein